MFVIMIISPSKIILIGTQRVMPIPPLIYNAGLVYNPCNIIIQSITGNLESNVIIDNE